MYQLATVVIILSSKSHECQQVKKLQAILKPMMLRRLKDDVEKNLAPKEETIIEVELTNIQKKYYRAILEKNFTFLAKGANQHNMPNLINTMMELRKCCNHPYLITGTQTCMHTHFLAYGSPLYPVMTFLLINGVFFVRG